MIGIRLRCLDSVQSPCQEYYGCLFKAQVELGAEGSWSQKSQKAGQLSTCLSEPKGNITKKSELQILPFSLTQSTSTKAIWKCICYVMQLHILLQLHAHQSRVYEYVHWSYVTCSYIFHVTEVVSFQLCYRQLLYTNCSANALMVV